ncbi:lysylphosphatidylglycerol synthase transmembrane domain-containing protein [Alsobacter sp. R-9]
MKRVLDFFWPLLGLVAVVWSVDLLYKKLKAEAAVDPAVKAALDVGSLWANIGTIASVIGQKIAAIPPSGYLLAGLSTLVAYWALAWYDRIALIHLNREKGISWLYIAVCSFVTYALSHNIGASVFSGGMVRYRAYTAKGLSATEVAVLVALCSFTFSFGTILLLGLVLVGEPHILKPLSSLASWFAISESMARLIGFGLLAFCALYTVGAWLRFRPLKIGSFELVYPRLNVVARQYVAAPLELIGAAGIIYFALPTEGNPGFFVVMGAFLLSFSAGLLSQVPGGVGVMEAVFLAIMPTMPAPAVFAALLVWRLFYLILPLVFSLPVVLLFERSQLARKAQDPPPAT